MPRVAIGVPVYNGGALLRDALECLRTQSFQDFEVVIGDNASDDETAETCAEFAARDSRFRHLRRPENIGSLANFQHLCASAGASLFCWRAYDDLSAPDYLEKLVSLFDRSPATGLAVADIRTVMDDRSEPRLRPWRQPPASPRVLRIAHQLRTARASWIYGLWDRAAMVAIQSRVHAAYPAAWGWDYLAMLPMILDGRVAGTRETHFEQRIFRAGTTIEERRDKLPTVTEWAEMRTAYSALCREFMAERDFSVAERAALAPLISRYVDRTCISRWRLMRARLGLSRHASRG